MIEFECLRARRSCEARCASRALASRVAGEWIRSFVPCVDSFDSSHVWANSVHIDGRRADADDDARTRRRATMSTTARATASASARRATPARARGATRTRAVRRRAIARRATGDGTTRADADADADADEAAAARASKKWKPKPLPSTFGDAASPRARSPFDAKTGATSPFETAPGTRGVAVREGDERRDG